MTGLLVTAIPLTIGPFPSPSGLIRVYLGYAASSLVFVHAFYFSLNLLSVRLRGRTLSQRQPRYLEYAYAVLISVGLINVVVMAPQFSDYIAYRRGDDNALYAQISQQAKSDLRDRCANGDRFFTKDYCEKLRRIAEAEHPRDYIEASVLNDHEFLSHITGLSYAVTQGGPQPLNEVSPITQHANALKARREYGAATPSPTGRALAWIGVLLLPIGISLRVVKTSLELFGRLK